jgi:excisionase family DNA binding protein
MARDGKVPSQKIGRAWRLDVEDLDKWMKKSRPETGKPEGD